jgi:hypothetical protein
VEGHPEICQAPDALVALGRPKRDRGSYKQWEEGGIAPQVVFEVLSPNHRYQEMRQKLEFYEEYGVGEYYLYDPDHIVLEGWRRTGDGLDEIPRMHGWTSPLLGIRFDLSGSELTIYGPDGRRFLTYQEIAQQNDQLTQERDQAVQERNRAVQERDRLARELEAERQRIEQMAAQWRARGLEPPE